MSNNVFLGLDASRVFRAFTVAAVTKRPVIVIGPPGTGKTDPLLAAASFYVAGDKERVWSEVLGAGTSPTIISGAVDLPTFMHSGRLDVSVKGTPFDPKYWVAIADEITRANTAVLDGMLPLLDMKPSEAILFGGTSELPPVRVATSNFSFQEIASIKRLGASLEAIADRMLALWVHRIEPDQIDFEALTVSQIQRNAVDSFASHQANIPDETDISLVVPRRKEMELLEEVNKLPGVVRAMEEAYDQINEGTSRRKPLILSVADKLTAKMSTMIGGEASLRRRSAMIEMMLVTRLLDLFRSVNPFLWREALMENDDRLWAHYGELAATESMRWSGETLVDDLSPLGVEALRLAHPAKTEEEFDTWSDAVDSETSAEMRSGHCVRQAYYACIKGSISGNHADIRNVQAIYRDLARQGDVFAAKLVHAYATLAALLIQERNNVYAADLLHRLNPTVWPLPKETLALAHTAFQQLNIRDPETAKPDTEKPRRVRRIQG